MEIWERGLRIEVFDRQGLFHRKVQSPIPNPPIFFLLIFFYFAKMVDFFLIPPKRQEKNGA